MQEHSLTSPKENFFNGKVGRDQDGTVPHYSVYQLANKMQSPMPMELLYLHRLRLFTHVIKSEDAHMIAVILEDFSLNDHNSWMRGVYHALR